MPGRLQERQEGKITTPTARPGAGWATLVFPGKDEACTSVSVVSPAENVVTFKWSAAANAEEIMSLRSKTWRRAMPNRRKVTTQTELAVTLPRNKDLWMGRDLKVDQIDRDRPKRRVEILQCRPGQHQLPTLSGRVTTPAFGTRLPPASSTLDWTGADADNDLTSYDVYFGTSASPPVFRTNVAESQLAAVPVTGNTTYYWMVVMKDTKGNSSRSEVYLL